MTALILSILAVLVTAVCVFLTARFIRRYNEMELQYRAALESERHHITMCRHMLRTLGVILPHNPMYDGPEEERETPWEDRQD